MSHGKGILSLKRIEKILRTNGFTYVRNNGHQIWKNDTGSTLVIPRSCCTFIINKMFKENNIIM